MSKVITLTSQNFEKEVLQFNGIVLVDFFADWCGPCKLLAPELEQLAKDLESNSVIKIAKLNTETNQNLAIEYQIRSIPNIIMFKNGNVVQQFIGLRNADFYKQVLLNEMLSE